MSGNILVLNMYMLQFLLCILLFTFIYLKHLIQETSPLKVQNTAKELEPVDRRIQTCYLLHF